VKPLINAILVVVFALTLVSAGFAEVIVLFDEDAKDEGGKGAFAPLFGSHDNGSSITITNDESVSGKVSTFCTPTQSYNNVMSGWSYPIGDTPYLTFAWKKDGGKIIMLQLAHDTAWAYRYYDGDNSAGVGPTWEGIQLDNEIPKDWVVYTRDLTKDFAQAWNLTGLAFTPWDGVGGYYDFLVLHSKENEVHISGKAVETEGKISTVWGKIKQD